MPSRSTAAAVDTRLDASLSFAPLDRPIEREQPVDARPLTPPDPTADRDTDQRTRRRRPRLVVEGARPSAAGPIRASTGGHLGVMSEYPVQLSKVQPPPLRDETLARDRLLDWLSVKIHRRAVLLIAEAGYGKTTLLSDFSRRTRIRVLWFRLDRGDRDWVGFIAYLVAAVRIHVPGFGPATSALLRETATTAPPLDTVLDTFLRELATLPNDPMAFVFDDFHLVDDSQDVRHILRELLARGPERMSLVFASRREPPIRLARLRALGEVAELSTDDLRFDAAETERLFRETYAMRLEPALLAELSRRTEGWAASLQLVRAALHERNPAQVRAFISSLSGAEGHLYEYLAEEVVGDLPRDLQQFLMRTSLLDTVDLVLGPVAAEVSEDEARRLIEEGERNGLFGRHDPSIRHQVRAHPLVRDFLQARLSRAVGDRGVRDIHLEIAEAAENVSWRLAARHYLLGGDAAATEAVLDTALDTIFATGAYEEAEELASQLPARELSGLTGLLLRSRLAQRRASVEEGLRLAELAHQRYPEAHIALLNLVTARMLAGDLEGAQDASRELQKRETDFGEIGRIYQLMFESSASGSLSLAAEALSEFATSRGTRGETHYQGVALLNLALVQTAMGEVATALESADAAIGLLEYSSASLELTSARLARSSALAHLGRMPEARAEMAIAAQKDIAGRDLEVAFEVGLTEALLGDPERAMPLMDRVRSRVTAATDEGEQALLSRALLHVALGNLDAATADTSELRHGAQRSALAFEARRLLLEGLVLALQKDPAGIPRIEAGARLARSQGARLWSRYGAVLLACADTERDLSGALLTAAHEGPAVLSMLADIISLRAADLSEAAMEAVSEEAERRPCRWRGPTRRRLEAGAQKERRFAAAVLALIGEQGDVQRLRDAGKVSRDRELSRRGLELARRLAAPVVVEDLGRVRIVVGDRLIEGSEIRRKVLALLCLLLSKPRFVSTREEVIDSLWPDQEPVAALNSLNQTVYFLRRVFEPDYHDETSPGYVGQDGETIWLDSALVSARSRICLEWVRAMPDEPSPEGSLALAGAYVGRFALDFAYEDWASPYRDSLHASYLRVMERAIRIDMNTGNFGRGTFLAERALEVDPDAEEIEAALVRLYRLSGAHAAAAEQYGHYVVAMRELGVEPPSLADL